MVTDVAKSQIVEKDVGAGLVPAHPCRPARVTFSSGPMQLQHPTNDGRRRQTAPAGRDKPCPYNVVARCRIVEKDVKPSNVPSLTSNSRFQYSRRLMGR
jgi:hypothetical protein